MGSKVLVAACEVRTPGLETKIKSRGFYVDMAGDGNAEKRAGGGTTEAKESIAEAMAAEIGEVAMETEGRGGNGDDDDGDDEGGVLLHNEEDEWMEESEPRTPGWEGFGDE